MSISYCSDACEAIAAARKLHSELECEALASFGGSEDEAAAADEDVADLVLQAVRILAHKHADRRVRPFAGAARRDGEHGAHDDLVVGVDDYAGRLQQMRRNKRTAAGIQLAAKAALRAMPPEARVPPTELFELLSRHQCNCVGLLGPANESVGLLSFLGGIHLVNHSCMPNAAFDSVPLPIVKKAARPAKKTSEAAPKEVVVDVADAMPEAPRAAEAPSAAETAVACRDPAAQEEEDDDEPSVVAFALRAIVDIPAGAEIFHCYAGSAEGPARRRQYLKDHHGFLCACERCAIADDPLAEMEFSERLEALRCRCDGCGSGLGYPVPPSTDDEQLRRCVHCGGTWDDVDEVEDEDEW